MSNPYVDAATSVVANAGRLERFMNKTGGYVTDEGVTRETAEDMLRRKESELSVHVGQGIIDINAARDAAVEDVVQAGASTIAEMGDALEQAEVARDTAINAAEAASTPLTAFFATKAAADAGLAGLPDGAWIEVAQDETADPVGVRTRYEKVSGAYVFRLNLDWLKSDLREPDGAGMIGYQAPYINTLPTNLDARMAAGRLLAIGDRVASGDSTADDAANINACLAEFATIGKAGIFEMEPASGSSNFYKLLNPIVMRSNITIKGHGPRTRLFNLASDPLDAGVFFAGQIALENFLSMTYYAGSNIAYGANTIQLTTPTDVNHFSDGQVVMIRTSALDANNFAKVMVFNRIVSRNAGTGVITFENPFLDAITSPRISDTTGGDFVGVPTGIVENVTIRDLAVYTESQVYMYALHLMGLYESLIENIQVLRSMSLASFNAFSRSVIRNVYGRFSYSVSECAMGSHDSLFENIRAAHTNTQSANNFLVNMTENSRRCTKRGYRINAPNWTCATQPAALLSVGPGIGHRVDDWDTYANWPSGNALIGSYAADTPVSDLEISNTRWNCTGMNRYVLLDQVSPTFQIQNLKLKNSRFYGAPSDSALHVAGGTPEIYIEDNFFEQGAFKNNSAAGAATGLIKGNTISSWSQTAKQWNKMKKRNNIRAGAGAVYAQDKDEFSLIVSSATVGASLLTYAIPAGQKIGPQDRIALRASGTVAGYGTGPNVNIKITDGTNTFINVATPSTAAAIVLELDVYFQSAALVYASARFIRDGVTPVVKETTIVVPDVVANGYTIDLQGWVDSAPDAFVLFDLKWEFVPYGQ